MVSSSNDVGADRSQFEMIIGRSSDCGLVLDHPSVSRNHAVLRDLGNNSFELEDIGSTKGTYVNKARIAKMHLREGDLVRFGNGSPYRFEEGRLVERPHAVGVSLEFEDLSVEFGGQKVLHAATASIEPDEFVAIVGPSGCGKSTLLSCLVQRDRLSDGRIHFDGGRDHSNQFEEFLEMTGVVPQAELLFDELTVEENLRFSARIRLPNPDAGITEKVDAALRAVDLDMHRNKPVGVLSGGQRKRVNVAVELIVRPRLLILDEPTSGLDPGMEAQLLNKLRGLSRQGITVVCVVHTRNLAIFDKVIQLRTQEGAPRPSVVYCGSPDGIGNLDLDIAAEEMPGDDESKSNSRMSRIRASALAPPVLPRIQIDRQRILNQAQTVFARSLLCFLRDRQSIFLSLFLPFSVAVLIVVSQREKGNPSHICFFLVIAAFWMGMNSGVREIVKERKLYVRDKLAGLVPAAFLLGKSCYCGLLSSLQGIVILVVAYLTVFWLANGTTGEPLNMLTSDLGVGSMLLSAIPLLAAGGGGFLTGLIVSTIASTERSALTTLPLILLPQILLSRIAYGDASALASKPPFGTVDSLPSTGIIDWVLYVGSLGFITRPTSMVMSLSIEASASGGATAVEWLYLLSLMTFYGIILTVLFLEKERAWKDFR